MTETEMENLVLELRAIRADVQRLGERMDMERIENMLGGIEQRLSAIEIHLRATQRISPMI